jgi:polyisoprenoid-binding protein YceI
MKEGLLSGLGHDHVVDAGPARASAVIAESSSSVHLELDTSGIDIDAQSSLLAEGFKKQVEESERAKIRGEMRGAKGLDVQRYPAIKFDSTSIEKVAGLKDIWEVTGVFSLHGSTGTLEFPVTLSPRPGGYWAYGYVRLRPSEYGMKPFSVLGGLIRVQDEALVKFDLALRPLLPSGR